jgi:cytochrome c-type biogenesis protein CcmH/NrfG
LAQESQPQPPNPSNPSSAAATWLSRQVAVLAVVSLIIGLIAGYSLNRSRAAVAAQPAAAVPGSVAAKTPGTHPPMTMEQMKSMADRQAGPLLEKLKTDPADATVLGQLGLLYSSAHQFQQSVAYYDKALQADPTNLNVRTQLASSLYYGGDVDAALKQLQQVLKSDPKNANALFNQGIMKWKGKEDAAGAIAAWEELLRSNPNLDRRATVEEAIAEAKGQQSAGK